MQTVELIKLKTFKLGTVILSPGGINFISAPAEALAGM